MSNLEFITQVIKITNIFHTNKHHYLEYRKFWLSRIDPIAKVNDIDPYIPWWLECNKERFPYWFGEREPRLEQLFEAFQKPHQYNLDSFMFYEQNFDRTRTLMSSVALWEHVSWHSDSGVVVS